MIVALNLEEPYRSAESLQKCANFRLRFIAELSFSAASKERYTEFVDFFNYFTKYFSCPRFSQLELSVAQNSREGKFVPIMVILVTREL